MSEESRTAGAGGRTNCRARSTTSTGRSCAELLRDGRISIRALAERVHISRANAYARLDRLVADGVITGFTAQLEPGAGRARHQRVRHADHRAERLARRLARSCATIPYVEHVALVGGDFDVLVLVRAPDNAALREVVLESIQASRACAPPAPGWSSTRCGGAAPPGRTEDRRGRTPSGPAVTVEQLVVAALGSTAGRSGAGTGAVAGACRRERTTRNRPVMKWAPAPGRSARAEDGSAGRSSRFCTRCTPASSAAVSAAASTSGSVECTEA